MNLFKSLYRYISLKTIESSKQISVFGIVMMINFPLFGLLWKVDGSELINGEASLRLTASGLCGLLATHNFWPYRLTRWLPICWYFTLIFCLPFFFTYLTLAHNLATLWLMNCISAMFFMLIIANALDALVMMFIGCSLAFSLFILNHHQPIQYVPGEISLLSLLITFGSAITIGALFARDKENTHAGKLTNMRMMAGSLAHDLRTPLASISLQTELQENLLQQLGNPQLQQDLQEGLKKITRGIHLGRQVINMQLNNILKECIDTKRFEILSVSQLLEKTITDYPLSKTQKNLIQIDTTHDYNIWTDKMGFTNLLWNLLNNSFHFIDYLKKGTVSIWLTKGTANDDFNYLHFKDTAKGLSHKSAEKIFDAMYSERDSGTGIGLSYCKSFMKAAGGDILCEGKSNRHIHFTLKFPKVD